MVHNDSFQGKHLTHFKTIQRNLGKWCKLAHFRTIAKVDLFQDHSEESWKLVQKLTPFKTITVAYTANHQKLTPFKTPVNHHHHQIDSFQDPMFVYSTKTVQIDSFQDPCIGLHSVFISMGDTLQIDSVKSPWETTFRKLVLSRPFYTVNFGLISRPV